MKKNNQVTDKEKIKNICKPNIQPWLLSKRTLKTQQFKKIQLENEQKTQTHIVSKRIYRKDIQYHKSSRQQKLKPQ